MNASELSRKMLFYGADDVTRYLEHNPFNQYLHALLVDAMHRQQVEVPMVTLFNELQYQCAHINYDATPGENIAGRYLAEAETWLGAHAAAQLVFCVVYSLLRIKQNITFHEECMLRQLPQLFTDGFGELSDDITKEFHAAQVRVPEVFATMTWPIDQLPESREAWPVVTCNYSPYVIEKLILLYFAPEDQLTLVDRIWASCQGECLAENLQYFQRLERDIKADKYWRTDTPSLRPNPFLFREHDDSKPSTTTVYNTINLPNVQQLNVEPKTVINLSNDKDVNQEILSLGIL